jgi:predicted RNA polymerase sigma factor
VAKRAWIDDHRRQGVFARIAPELATGETLPAQKQPGGVPDELDDRVALLFVACDDSLAPGARMVLALGVVCGLTIAQTAVHLGIQENATAARLTRARRALARARGEFRVREQTAWPRIVQLYEALGQVWPSPAVDLARLTALGQMALAGDGDLSQVERALLRVEAEGPTYARRDAAFALADLWWRTGRRDEAAERYRELAGLAESDAARRSCLRRAGPGS